jgi:hypothetical protein
MATTSVVSSGLASIAPELKPYYVGAGTPGSADYIPGLLPEAQKIYDQNYAQQIGNQLTSSGLGGAGRVAQLTPLEQQVGQQVSEMQTPGQFGTGSNLSTAAGQGQLQTVSQAANYANMGANYGNQGYGIGQQAAGLASGSLFYGNQGAQAGSSYGQNATNANAVNAYMNPYLQNSLNPQLQMMNRSMAQQQNANNAQAAAAGAFGGNRQAVLQGQTQFNNQLAQQQLVGNAYNTAYNTAQQNMQQAANLGMQGAQVGLAGQNAANAAYQTGLQGTAQGMQGAQIGLQGVGAQQAGYAGANQAAATLGQLGTEQQAADVQRLQAMSAQGTTERGISQQGLDTQYQDLMTKLTYPQQQLAGMQGILTGVQTPSVSSTQTTTTPPPSFASQLAGTGLSGLALYNMFK